MKFSYAQLKMHNEATVTASIKNIALGWPPTEEHGHLKKNLGIHNNLHGFIRAMAEKVFSKAVYGEEFSVD
jgi:hypothetical protein